MVVGLRIRSIDECNQQYVFAFYDFLTYSKEEEHCFVDSINRWDVNMDIILLYKKGSMQFLSFGEKNEIFLNLPTIGA